MLQIWKKHGVMVYAGYITGFPFDTRESILRDLEIIKRELAIEVVEFFYLTPLPGSEDHQRLTNTGVLDGPGHEQVLALRARHASHEDERRGVGARPITRPGRAITTASTSSASCGAPRRTENR